MLIMETSKVRLVFHESEKIIHHQIHEPLSDDELKEMLLRGAELFEENGLEKWLSDDRKQGPISEEIERWGQEVWNQRMFDAGWKYWALVLPKEALGPDNKVRSLIFTFSKIGGAMKLFSDADLAMKWLVEQ